jgi:thiol-disulfide isomerase/thioredoxin
MERMRSLLLAAVAIASFAFQPSAAAQEPQKLKVGSAAPSGAADHLIWVKGDPVTEFSKEKVYVVEFWATWCGPCKKSIPHLSQLQRDLGPKGLEIIGISDEEEATVRDFVRAQGSSMDYTVATKKKDDDAVQRDWMQAAEQKGIPCAFVVSRTGKVVFIGHPLDPEFDRAVKLTLANRYDPELMKRVEGTIAAARKSAKARNYKEATGLYEKAVAEGPSTLLDVSLECWRMLAEQANDDAGAKAFIRKTADGLSGDRHSLAELVTYLAADPSVKKRDLAAAGYAADKLKAAAGGADDPDSKVALATLAAAQGDFAAAAEMQYDAWMAASPAAKPAIKRALDVYESKTKDAAK